MVRSNRESEQLVLNYNQVLQFFHHFFRVLEVFFNLLTGVLLPLPLQFLFHFDLFDLLDDLVDPELHI